MERVWRDLLLEELVDVLAKTPWNFSDQAPTNAENSVGWCVIQEGHRCEFK